MGDVDGGKFVRILLQLFPSRTMPRYEASPRDRSPPLPPSVREAYVGSRSDRGRVKSPTDRRIRDRSPLMHRGPPQVSSRDVYADPYARQPQTRTRESGSSSSSSSRPQYKILCVSNLNQKVNDGGIRDALIREFGRFGDLDVKVCII